MALFGKDDPAAAAEPRRSPDNRGQAGDGALSIIATGMRIKGDIDTDGVVKIEGRVEGTVRAGRQVLVGRQGEVHGDIITSEAVIGGRVQGKLNASERVEVQGTSTILGDIETKAINVVEGGKINGSVRISDGSLANEIRRDGKSMVTPIAVKAVS